MKPKEEIKIIENELINRLCWIPDLDTILPHKVFVEDENEKGEPEYYYCTLEAINQEEQTCTLLNHSTGERSSDWYLAAINIDWLVTLWEWYKEKHAEDEIDTELLYLAESGEWHERAIMLMSEYTEADDEAIRDYAAEHWQNLRSDKDNLAEFREYLKNVSGTSASMKTKPLIPKVGDNVWIFNKDRRDKANDRYGEITRIGKKYFYVRFGIYNEARFETTTLIHDNGKCSPRYELYPSQEACEFHKEAEKKKHILSDSLLIYLTDEEATSLYNTLIERATPK